jgi:hypothetical protein
LIENGVPVSAGRFTVDGVGDPSQTMFTVLVGDSADVSTYVLTIEPDPDPDPAPSATHLLGGDFSANQANITVGHGAALGDDFTSSTGGYILAAPSSSGSDGATYKNGIWWLDPAVPAASLSLPTLPAGWVYEGWVASASGPVSTGTFTDVAAADSDAGGPAAGPNPTPPFPGQDFINPMTDLTAGFAAVISIEPSPDNSPAPFTLKPLVDGMIDDVGGGVLQMMGNNAAATNPTGVVTLVDLDEVTVNWQFDGLEDLGAGWVYEGWLIDNGMPVSAGRFTVDGSGTPSATMFDALVSDIGNVSTYVLTIEPDPDSDPAPSATHLLAGDFSSNLANVTIDHPAALGDDFTSSTGDYILAAPSSSGSDGATYKNGIWWLDPAGPAASLNLPTLPAGWVYEGWVADASGAVSTGTFTDVAAADSDAGGPAAGPNPTPPFPGQDFINPMKDLTDGYAAVISIEPSPDNSPAPFTLKPLVDGMIDDVGGGVLQMMANNATASSPTGMVTLAPSEPPTAIEMADLNASVNHDGSVNIDWTTASEIANAGFNVYRSVSADAIGEAVNGDLIASTASAGSGASYRFVDAPGSGVFYYQVEAVDTDGSTSLYGPVEVIAQAPTSTSLTQFGGNNMTVLPLLVATLVIALFVTVALLRRRDA